MRYCATPTRLGTCRQLQVDIQHLLSFLLSDEGGLHLDTQRHLRGLSVCADMRRGLAALTGESEEEEEEGTPLRFEGELGRLLHHLSVVEEVSALSGQDWK